MNKPKASSAGHTASDPEGACDFLVDRATQHSCAPMVTAGDEGEQTARSMVTFPGLQTLEKPRPLRVAIKVRGKILFINLGDVVSVQAKGKHVSFQQTSGSCLLRESISVVAGRLETHGFIRIHRSVLVNTSFVEEIRPVSTGKYSLRVAGGKEYTVTRIYRKNLKFLAEFWIGTGAPFLG
jgi:DNA-binding LytR/AlgR family response regulator